MSSGASLARLSDKALSGKPVEADVICEASDGVAELTGTLIDSARELQQFGSQLRDLETAQRVYKSQKKIVERQLRSVLSQL